MRIALGRTRTRTIDHGTASVFFLNLILNFAVQWAFFGLSDCRSRETCLC
jgi:hypothetical protein